MAPAVSAWCLPTVLRLLDDWIAARVGHTSMTTEDPGNPSQRDNLYEPREDMSEYSSLHPMTRKTSLALTAQLHPRATLAAVAGVIALIVATRTRTDTRDQRTWS